MRLIDYTVEFESLLARLEQDEENLDLQKEIDALGEQTDAKLEQCGWMFRNLCAEAAAFADESERLAVKSASRGRQAEQLKNYIAYCLQGKNIKTKTFSFSHRKSESVEIPDETLVPMQYLREKISVAPDKTLIKADLKAGATIPGCQIVEKQNLQIK